MQVTRHVATKIELLNELGSYQLDLFLPFLRINCNIVDNEGFLPMIIASRNRLTDIVKILANNPRTDVNIMVT